MSDHRYHPAARGWILLCRDDLVLGVAPTATEERIATLWPLVRDGAGSAALLDEMTRGGISAAPEFALFEKGSSSWRVLARGAVTVDLPATDEPPVDGSGTTAWVERDIVGSPVLRGRVGTAEADRPRRPIRFGVVTADVWEIGPELADADSSPTVVEASAAQPAPTVDAGDEARQIREQTLVAQTLSASELIGRIPGDDADPAETEPEAAAEADAVEADAGYDHLFGVTVARRVEEAAVREPDESEESAPVEERTKVATDLAARRALRRAAKAAAESEAAVAGPRHWLELSTGGREELEGAVIVGRAPSATRVSAGNIPRLVTMNTPNQDISRTHAQIALEGETVVVTDLHSSNGTFVIVPGRSPQKLRAGEPTPVVVGTVIDLGDGATLTVRADS